MSSTQTSDTDSRIDWPAELSRTPAADRERTPKFDVTLASALDDLEQEMERLDVDDYRLSTAARQRKRDNRPYANASPDDPAVVMRWSKDGEQFAIGCDCWTRLRDNVRELGLHIREKRKMEQRPVASARSEFATARLPSGDEDAVVASGPPHEILEVPPDADRDAVETAYRAKVQVAHPDKGGSVPEFERVREAREAMLDE